MSDLVSNATRCRLAEYIVARALGISTAGVRDEWAAYDLITPDGIRIEVKSAAYLQSWRQTALSKVELSGLSDAAQGRRAVERPPSRVPKHVCLGQRQHLHKTAGASR